MPAKTTTPATPTDQRPTCSVCGSHDVETTAWIQYRPDGTEAIVEGEGPFGDESGNWCHDCQEHTELTYPDFTPADRARAQAADAAREAGPELLDACRQLLAAFSDMIDGYQAEELHATPADIIRQAARAIARGEGRDDTDA